MQHDPLKAAEQAHARGRFSEAAVHVGVAIAGEHARAREAGVDSAQDAATRSTLARLHCMRSVARFAQGTTTSQLDSLRDANEAARLVPRSAWAHYQRAVALRSLRQYAAAEAALAMAVEVADVNEEGDSNLLRKVQEATEELAKMVCFDGAGDHPLPGGVSAAALVADYREGGEVESEGSAGKDSSTGIDGSDALPDLLPPSSADEADPFVALERWLLSTGTSSFPLLYMQGYSDSNRGVHSRADTGVGSLIMKIGREFLITVEMGRACPIGRKVAAAAQHMTFSALKHCYICIFVLCDRRNPRSFFAPYYRILPPAYPNIPVFWSEEELAYLDASYMVQQVRDRRLHLQQDYENICAVAPEFAAIASLNDFMWARMMVASRNFGVVIDGHRTDALVPYADMLNHYRPRQTRWAFDYRYDAFAIHTVTPLLAGQQVFDSYGKKCNSRFLLNYGFTVEQNTEVETGEDCNEVRVLLFLLPPSSDPLHARKLDIAGEAQRDTRLSTWAENTHTVETFSFLRFVHADAEELSQLSALGMAAADEMGGYDFAAHRLFPVSAKNEARVLTHLSALCKQLARCYATTLEEDEAALASGAHPFGSNRRNALVLLAGEKRILRYYVELAALAFPLLACSGSGGPGTTPCYADWRVVKQQLVSMLPTVTDRGHAAYLKDVVGPLLDQELTAAAAAEGVPVA